MGANVSEEGHFLHFHAKLPIFRGAKGMRRAFSFAYVLNLKPIRLPTHMNLPHSPLALERGRTRRRPLEDDSCARRSGLGEVRWRPCPSGEGFPRFAAALPVPLPRAEATGCPAPELFLRLRFSAREAVVVWLAPAGPASPAETASLGAGLRGLGLPARPSVAAMLEPALAELALATRRAMPPALRRLARRADERELAMLLAMLLMLASGLPALGQASGLGTSKVTNYPTSVYGAATQNWAAAQGAGGEMYFANNDGLLRFDGLNWDLLPLGTISPPRSVLSDSLGRVFVGMSNDFGQMVFREGELPRFESLRHLLPPGLGEFDDVWRIHALAEGVVFQCYDYFFVYSEGKVEVHRPRSRFHYSFVVAGRLVLHEPGLGLFVWEGGGTRLLPWSGGLADEEVVGLHGLGPDSLLVCTASRGLFTGSAAGLLPFESEASAFLRQHKLFSTSALSDGGWAFGTILGGVVLSDEQGRVEQRVGSVGGLQSNTVLSLLEDREGNLWAGLDNGIDYLEARSPLRYLRGFDGLVTGYASHRLGEQFYFGTNQGLYRLDANDLRFNGRGMELVEGTQGQVWWLGQVDGQLLCGHHTGGWLVEGGRARRVDSLEGAWCYIGLAGHPDVLLGGHYQGLSLLRRGPDGWRLERRLPGFDESSRYLAQDADGSIWVSHGALGVFRLVLSEKLDSVVEARQFDGRHGLPSGQSNILFVLDGQILVSTVAGIYRPDAAARRFVAAPELDSLFGLRGRLKVVSTDPRGNVWFIDGSEAGVLRLNEDRSRTLIRAPFAPLRGSFVNEFESIHAYDSQSVLFGTKSGFAHYWSGRPMSYASDYRAFVRRVELPGLDLVVHWPTDSLGARYAFAYGDEGLRFVFSAIDYTSPDRLEFSYLLEGFSDAWSSWGRSAALDVKNLGPGSYRLRVRARNQFGAESQEGGFSFRILPPWYRTAWAYAFYGMLSLALATGATLLAYRRWRASKQREADRHRRALDEQEAQFQRRAMLAEQQIERLRTEKLRDQVAHRDKELANQTVNLLRKNELMMSLQDDIAAILETSKEPDTRQKLRALKSQMGKELDNKQQNQLFETYFDEVHADFFNRLRERHPDLLPKELRLCAMIVMGHSTKDIAVLLNLSYRGVETSRYRLRKKMDLEAGVHLSTYLASV